MWAWGWLAGCVGGPADVDATSGAAPVAVTPQEAAPALDGAVRVVVRVPEPHTHRVQVEEVFETGGAAAVTVRMPVWTPGSYLVREYARQVETFAAFAPSGEPLTAKKVAKNRWEIATGGAGSVVVRMQIYAREPSVRSNLVEVDQAVLVGAATFVEPIHLTGAAYDVRMEVPPAWEGAWSALDPHPDGQAAHWVARSWDELLDSPIVAGRADVQTFDVFGVPHRLVSLGGDGWWDFPAARDDVARIVREEVATWGVVPYDHYDFFNVIAEGGGGLEHLDSTLMFAKRAAGRDPEARRKWLGLVSHELFHAWNVKRLRPAALGPFDYEREVHTPSLWVAEGVTSYYDDLVLARAGLMTESAYLAQLSKAITTLEEGHGRRVQPLTDASFDAWIKHYRPDENAENRQVDYYVKGALVGWLLDARLREATRGAASLDTALRLAWARFPEEQGYTEEALRALFSEVAGQDLGPWLAAMCDEVGELDYGPALRWFGLRFAAVDAPDPSDGPTVTLGLEPAAVVAKVRVGTPAYQAGVDVGDELIALDGLRVVEGDLDAHLRGREAGQVVTLLVSRRGRLVSIPVTLAERPVPRGALEVDPAASAAAQARRAAWLRPWAPIADASKE
jgi:predicted metalloprotease with PDZ domain